MVKIIPLNELQRTGAPAPHPGLPAFAMDQCQRHACDSHVVVLAGGAVVARASLWWSHAPTMPGEQPGIVGHFSAIDGTSAIDLLDAACAELKRHGCTMAIGPMDGNTWRRYRLLTERGAEPTFFLEPDNPDEWPLYFQGAKFVPLATYFSAMNDDLSAEDPRVARATQRLAEAGVHLRAFQAESFVDELRRIYTVSRASFQENFLYSPIDEAEFLAQYEPIRAHVVPQLIIVAEQDQQPVGFVFSIPDLAQAKRGQAVNTVVLKTVAVLPGRRCAGLGNVLVAQCQQTARALGFRRVIHALMHESNNSVNLSARYAKPFRRYVLYARRLQVGDRA